MTVEMCKERGVLGVRIAGGSDKPYGRGLVRIKQVTTDTASSRSGSLKEGDIILQVIPAYRILFSHVKFV